MMKILPLLILILLQVRVSGNAQSWQLVDNLHRFITDIEIHNGERYTAIKTGQVLLGDSIIRYFPVQDYQETGLLSLTFWQDSLCVMVSGLDSIQRVICGTDTLLQVSYKSPWSIRHRAGDMVATDSVLYAAFGYGENPNDSQSASTFRGKIIALTSDTTYIFAYGMRNPWKMDIHNDTLYIADVGNQSEEEVDRISLDSVGKNFGWPCVEGEHVFDTICGVTLAPFFRYKREHAGNAIIGGKYFDNAFWWCDNFYRFGGYVRDDTTYVTIPCPQYPDGMYVQGDSLYVYDYTGKIYRWTEGPLSLDSFPVKPQSSIPPELVITNEYIKWTKELDGTFMVLNITGQMVAYEDASVKGSISLDGYVPGIYALVLINRHGAQWSKLFAVI